MAVTFANLQREALRILGEPTNSTIGEIPDGAGAVTETTQQAVVRAMNAGQDWLCRRCIPIDKYGTFSLLKDTRAVAFSALTMETAGYRMWAARELYWNAQVLDEVDEDILRIRDERYLLRKDSYASKWYEDRASRTVYLYPTPTITRGVRLWGLCLPPVIVASSPATGQTATPDFIADDLLYELLPPVVAIYLAKRLFEDPSVYGRLSHIVRQVNERTRRIWQDLRAHERSEFYPDPPEVEGL